MNLHFFMNQLIRDTVIVAVYLDMVIDIDPGRLPFGKDESMNRKGFEDGFFQGFKETLSGSLEFFKGAVIEKLQLFLDRLVQFCQVEEGAVSQRSQDPALDLKNS